MENLMALGIQREWCNKKASSRRVWVSKEPRHWQTISIAACVLRDQRNRGTLWPEKPLPSIGSTRCLVLFSFAWHDLDSSVRGVGAAVACYDRGAPLFFLIPGITPYFGSLRTLSRQNWFGKNIYKLLLRCTGWKIPRPRYTTRVMRTNGLLFIFFRRLY